MMATVVVSPAQATAFRQLLLVAMAVDIVQKNQACPVAKVGVGVCRDSVATANLLAHHLSIDIGPVIITHRPPASLVVDLHPTLARVQSTHQTNGAIS